MKNTAILKLKEMLEKANIPFEFEDDFFGTGEPAYSLRIIKDGKQLCDVIEHSGSYGNASDLLEIMGGLTIEEGDCDSVKGHLTAEEVFERFKYCYEHNTSTYSTDFPEVQVGDIIKGNDNTCYQVIGISDYDCAMIALTNIPIPIKDIISVYRYGGRDYKLVWQKENNNV